MPAKEPNTKRDYGYDYSGELGTDTITASTWEADEGLVLSGASFDATSTSVWIEGGENGQTLAARNRVTTTAGRTYERTLTLLIRPAVDEQDDLRIMASDLVALHAPAPPNPTPDYFAKAARAERLVFGYLKATGGYKTSTSTGLDVLRRGESYGKLDEVEKIIRRSMGSYAKDSGASSFAVISTFRR